MNYTEMCCGTVQEMRKKVTRVLPAGVGSVSQEKECGAVLPPPPTLLEQRLTSAHHSFLGVTQSYNITLIASGVSLSITMYH